MSAAPSPDRAWFPALIEPQVRKYLLGQALSMLGAWTLDITLNLLVWQLTGSPATLGLLNFLLYGPGVLVTLGLSSRLTAANARRITVRVLGAALALALVLVLAAAMQWLSLPLLLGAAALRGVLGGMEVPSRQMLLLNICADPSRLGNVVAMNTVVFLLARSAGPGLAGLMFAPLGPVWAFALAALTLGFMLRCVLQLQVEVAAPPAGTHPGTGGLRGAWAFVRGDSFGSLFMPVVACVAFCVGAYQTLVPVLASRVFGDASFWTGWFYAAACVGALVAALLLSSRHMDALLQRMLLAVAWCGVLALAVLAVSSHPLPTLLSFALLGFCTSFVGTGTNATLQRRVPPQARGGLIALFLLAFIGPMPLAQLVAGALAQWLSVGSAFALLAGTLLAGLLILFGARWHQLGRIELDITKL